MLNRVTSVCIYGIRVAFFMGFEMKSSNWCGVFSFDRFIPFTVTHEILRKIVQYIIWLCIWWLLKLNLYLTHHEFSVNKCIAVRRFVWVENVFLNCEMDKFVFSANIAEILVLFLCLTVQNQYEMYVHTVARMCVHSNNKIGALHSYAARWARACVYVK